MKNKLIIRIMALLCAVAMAAMPVSVFAAGGIVSKSVLSETGPEVSDLVSIKVGTENLETGLLGARNPDVVESKSNIKVVLDTEQLTFDTDPVIVNDRTFVPMRAIFEALGAEVNWSDRRHDVVATLGFDEIILKIGSTVAVQNAEAVELDAAPFIQDDRTMVPLRFLSEALGCTVDWDGATRTVFILTAERSEEMGEENHSSADDNSRAASILGDDADVTYDDAFVRTVRNSAACRTARLNLRQAEQQSDEFNNMYSWNISFTLMQTRQDLKLLQDWREKNVVVTEEQAAFRTQCAMDDISLKLVEIENQKSAVDYAKKCLQADREKYALGAISLKTLTASEDAVTTAEKSLESMETELDALYIKLAGYLGMKVDELGSPEFILDYQEIGEVNMQQEYNRALANDPYIWYVENAVKNADFDLQTYEWNMGGKSWTLTKMDLQAAENNETATKANLRNELESRYNQLIQLENNISMLEDQRDTLLENIDTMRTMYENGMQSKNDFEAVLQNNRTISYNLLSLKIKHEQLKATFEKPYLNPSYMSVG